MSVTVQDFGSSTGQGTNNKAAVLSAEARRSLGASLVAMAAQEFQPATLSATRACSTDTTPNQ